MADLTAKMMDTLQVVVLARLKDVKLECEMAAVMDAMWVDTEVVRMAQYLDELMDDAKVWQLVIELVGKLAASLAASSVDQMAAEMVETMVADSDDM